LGIVRRVWIWLTAGAALLVCAFVARSAWRAARDEDATFHPERHPVPRPDPLGDLEGLEDASFKACSDLAMEGWWVPSKNGAAIALAHGTNADRSDLLSEARALARAGYGVLVYDQPGHGESQGNATLGACEIEALQAALGFMTAHEGVDAKRLGAIGLSAGGAVVALTAEKEPRLRAIALVATYTDYEEHIRYEYRSTNPIARRAALSPSRRTFSRPLRPVDALTFTKARAVLVIGGTDDPAIAPWMPPALDAAAAKAGVPDHELWMIPGGRHLDYDAKTSGVYTKRLVAFFDRALKP
jgi:alpha-beta hydrolase superfamily lysophospholipase